MLELNQQINWIPSTSATALRQVARGRPRLVDQPQPLLGLTRSRSGSDDPAYPRIDVYGSLDELERDFGVRPTDLHRP
jgi:isoleucyl-tRNA synthetase